MPNSTAAEQVGQASHKAPCACLGVGVGRRVLRGLVAVRANQQVWSHPLHQQALPVQELGLPWERNSGRDS